MFERGARLGGRYVVRDPLGSGGMGVVLRADDTRLGREVAVKVLPAALAADSDYRQRFDREARAGAALSHPNVLSIHDIGCENGVVYFVTELLVGSTLREKSSEWPLTALRAAELGLEIVRGLARRRTSAESFTAT